MICAHGLIIIPSHLYWSPLLKILQSCNVCFRIRLHYGYVLVLSALLYRANLGFPISAAANETAAAQRDHSQDLPFHYIPTGWVGITFLALFGITTSMLFNFFAPSSFVAHLLLQLLTCSRQSYSAPAI